MEPPPPLPEPPSVPEPDAPGALGKGLLPNELYSIAVRQRHLLLSILGYLLAIVAQFTCPSEYEAFCATAGITISVVAAVCLFRLARKFHSVAGCVVLAILTLIPFLGLGALVLVDSRATSILKANGIHVGLLGADVNSIRRL